MDKESMELNCNPNESDEWNMYAKRVRNQFNSPEKHKEAVALC